MCRWARGQQSCRPRREDGGNIGLQRQGKGYQRRTRPGVALGLCVTGWGRGGLLSLSTGSQHGTFLEH